MILLAVSISINGKQLQVLVTSFIDGKALLLTVNVYNCKLL